LADVAEPDADLSLESLQAGQAAVLAATGLVAFAITTVAVDQPWVFVVSGLAGGAAGLGLAWLLGRHLVRGQYDGLPVASGPPRRPASGVLVGAAYGFVSVATGGAVLVGEVLVLDEAGLYRLAGPLSLAFAGVVALSRGQLVRWQERAGLVVYTRAGARHFAWTRSQARARLVVVASPALEPATLT
jgi:hypothetical protein